MTGPILGNIGALIGMQSSDYRAIMVANLPADDSSNPWDSDGPVSSPEGVGVVLELKDEKLNISSEIRVDSIDPK